MERGIQKIVNNKSGDVTYRVQVMGNNGKRVSRTFDKLSDARAARTQLKAQADRRMLAGSDGQTVMEAVEQMIRDKELAGRAGNTVVGYRSVLACHIAPHRLGQMKVSAVTRRDVRDFYADLNGADGRKKQGHRMQCIIRTVLKQTFGLALQHDVISINPCVGVPLFSEGGQKGRVRSLKFWTQTQQQAFIQGNLGSPWLPMVQIALATGLRNGELCGLRWEDVLLGRACPQLLVRNNRTNVAGRPTMTTPKTASSRRTVPLTASGQGVLRGLLARQQAEWEALGLLWTPQTFVFTGTKGEAMNISRFNKVLRRMCQTAGVEYMNPHGLRHSFGSKAIKYGTSVAVSRVMGHSRPSTTLDLYCHASNEDVQELMLKMA